MGKSSWAVDVEENENRREEMMINLMQPQTVLAGGEVLIDGKGTPRFYRINGQCYPLESVGEYVYVELRDTTISFSRITDSVWQSITLDHRFTTEM